LVEKSGKVWEKSKILWKNMFLGEYQYNIDEKKRLALPAHFRRKLGKRIIITRGLDSCLFLFPLKEWNLLVKKISKLPLAKSDARGFARLMLTGAMEVEFDNLGRILIPDFLKEYASLKKRVIIAGVFNRIEIWDEEKWKEYKLKAEKEAGDIAERLSEIGI